METVNPRGTKHHFRRGKAGGSWKGVKKTLEEEMLCPALRGRVRYDCSVCPEFGSLSNTFTVRLDGEELKAFNALHAWKELGRLDSLGDAPYPEAIHTLPYEGREEYEAGEFASALQAYRSQGIKASLASEDPIVRMFAIVDRRVGKRTLRRLQEAKAQWPAWLERLLRARLEAEDIPPRY